MAAADAEGEAPVSVRLTDEQILRARLLTRDSVVIGPSLSRVAAKLADLAFQTSPAGSADAGAVQLAHDQLVRELLLIQLEMDKLSSVFPMCDAETAQYEELERSVTTQIDAAQSDISRLKEELVQQRRLRRHREECEAMAALVDRFPARSATKEALGQAQAQVDVLQQKLEATTAHMERRAKQFRLLLQTTTDLMRTLDEDAEIKQEVEAAQAEEVHDQDDDGDEDKDGGGAAGPSAGGGGGGGAVGAAPMETA